MISLKEFALLGKPFVVAHRGASAVAPENTFIAIEKAISAGAKMVEIDVQLTKDHVPIVFHDAVLGRTSNGSGFVGKTTWAEMESLDVGSWFGEEYGSERIPELSAMLERIKGRAYVNIELKVSKHTDHLGYEIERILAVIDEKKMVDQVLFGSFNYELLQLLKTLEPAAHTAGIQHPRETRLPAELNRAYNFSGYVCSQRELSGRRIESAREAEMIVGVYGLNSKSDLTKAVNLGVQALVTDHPANVIGWLKEMNIEA